MSFLRPLFRFLMILFCVASVWAQSVPPPPESLVATDTAAKLAPVEIKLIVPVGTPLRVAVRDRVRIQHDGDPVRATLTQSVFAFDTEVIPAGSEVNGRIKRIEPVTKKRRTLAIADGDFTPAHAYSLALDSVVLPDGRLLTVGTEVSRGSAMVVHLVTDPERAKKKNKVAEAAAGVKQEAKDKVHSTIADIKSPGRMARLKRYLAAQLPFRRQFLEAGTRFNAVLEEPLNFGTVTRTSEELAALGTMPPDGSMLVAQLSAEVTSATAQPGSPIEAVVTTPLFNAEQKLVVPANSKLLGEVVQAKAARKLHRNGQLRVAFQRIELPDGVAQPVRASLEGMEVDRAAGLKLDSEGGARATDAKRRYLSTALAVFIATSAAQHDSPDPGEPAGAGDPGADTVAGGSGLKLVGAVTGYLAHSQVFSAVLGAYGAMHSIYSNFLSRGRDVVLPRNTPLEISFGKAHPPSGPETK